MAEEQGIESGLVDEIRRNSTLTVVTGVVMVICGILAIGAPMAAGLYVTIFVGAMLAVGGISQCFLAFKAGAFGRGLMIFIIGLLTAIAGFYLIGQPVAGLASITLFLAAYFIATGIFDAVASFQFRPAAGWGWDAVQCDRHAFARHHDLATVPVVRRLGRRRAVRYQARIRRLVADLHRPRGEGGGQRTGAVCLGRSATDVFRFPGTFGLLFL